MLFYRWSPAMHSSVWHWQALPSLALLTGVLSWWWSQETAGAGNATCKILVGLYTWGKVKKTKKHHYSQLKLQVNTIKEKWVECSHVKSKNLMVFHLYLPIFQCLWRIHTPWATEHICTNVKRQICYALPARLCKKQRVGNADTICHRCATFPSKALFKSR